MDGACSFCGVGTYNANGEDCVACDPGRYSSVVGSTECSLCEAGTFSNDAGSILCFKCSAGTYSESGAAECMDCPGGKFLPNFPDVTDHGTPSACLDCPVGKISAAGTIEESACDKFALVSTHFEFFNLISTFAGVGVTNTASGRMSNGNKILTNPGTYACASDCASEDVMYVPSGLDGDVICKSDPPVSCVLDGQESRRIFEIVGTAGGEMRFRRMKFYRGSAVDGAGISVSNSGKIILELCEFNSCRGTGNGAGILLTSTGSNTATLYAVSFSHNTGEDIYNNGGQVTIEEECAEDDYTGMTSIGGDLVTSGTIQGLIKSYATVDCSLSCEAGTSHNGLFFCSVCVPGSFSLCGEASCELCSKGKYLSNIGDKNRHDEAEDCKSCPGGKSSKEGADACFAVEEVRIGVEGIVGGVVGGVVGILIARALVVRKKSSPLQSILPVIKK